MTVKPVQPIIAATAMIVVAMRKSRICHVRGGFGMGVCNMNL